MGKYFKSGSLVAMAATAILMSSCAKEFELYDPVKDVTAKYEKNWKENFGNIDPNQNWNMATQVEATISVPASGSSSKVLIYTANPFSDDANLIAEKYLSDNSPLVFDAIKGMAQIYAIINNGKYNISMGYYDIVNGKVNINGNSVAKAMKRGFTRAGETCNVTIGTKIDLGSYKDPIHHDAVYENVWDGKSYELHANNKVYYYKKENGKIYKQVNNEWVEVIVNEWGNPTINGAVDNDLLYSSNNSWDSANKDFKVTCDENGSYGMKKQVSKALVKEAWDETFPYGDFYELNNVAGEAGQSWKQGVGYGLYGTGKFFQELVKYWEGDKPSLEGYNLDAIEAGVPIVTEKAGPLTLSFVYGATQIVDAFGYLYYTDGQDKSKAPRFILIKDARPDKNIFHDTWGGTAVGNMDLSVWSNYEALVKDKDREPLDWEISQNVTPMQKYISAYNKKYVGTDYKMVYFGENYDEAGTYEFPANVHIEFFIINRGYADNPDYKSNLNNLNYGDPDMNKEILHYRMRDNSSEHGAVKGTTWMYGGVQYVGFEDGGGDEDLNDIVFSLEGNIDTEDIPEVPSEEPAIESNSWIIACEDLGSTDDYDFNDIVFKVSHVAGQNVATVTPLAAGGIYASYITYNGTALGETHQMLGAEESTSNYPMINTSSITATGQSQNITVPANFSLTDGMGGLGVSVNIDNGTAVLISAPDAGTAPQMICMPGDWAWPKERTKIQDAYNKFADWNTEESKNLDWYLYPTAGNVLGGN